MLHPAVSDAILNLREQVGSARRRAKPTGQTRFPKEMCWLKNLYQITHKVEQSEFTTPYSLRQREAFP